MQQRHKRENIDHLLRTRLWIASFTFVFITFSMIVGLLMCSLLPLSLALLLTPGNLGAWYLFSYVLKRNVSKAVYATSVIVCWVLLLVACIVLWYKGYSEEMSFLLDWDFVLHR